MTARASTAYDYSRYQALKLFLRDDGVMTVTLSNPGKKNAMTREMSAELTTIWDDLLVDRQVRLIILTGEGGDFCAGVDMANLAADSSETQFQPVNIMARAIRRHMLSMLDCEKPILAKLRGVAYGIGANLVLACDMIFAAHGARICDSHVKAGLVCGDGGVLLWPTAMGIHRAKQYLMTGTPIPAEKAETMGLINACVADDELDATVDSMAQSLLALPPHAVNYTKASLNLALRQMTGPAFEASVAYELYSMQMDDAREAASAFMDKRSGKFEGR